MRKRKRGNHKPRWWEYCLGVIICGIAALFYLITIAAAFWAATGH